MNVKATTKREQAEATKAALLKAARALFAERGYADVGMEEVVRKAGVTRGALYHHFASKSDLLRAVYEAVEREMTERVARVALEAGGDPWNMSLAGLRAFLDACDDPEFGRIALLDAPAVLGPQWREIADRYGGALIRANLEALIDANELDPQPVGPLARILTGGLVEGAMAIAESDRPEATREDVYRTIERLMSGMRRTATS